MASDCSSLCTSSEIGPPGVGDQCTANIYYETSLSGGDLPGQSGISVADWAACCDLCNNATDCYAW
jgi:hypothetical protein